MFNYASPLFNMEVELKVAEFYATPAVAEIGSTVSSVVLRWGFSRDPDVTEVAGQTLYGPTNVLTVVGPFTQDQQWKIKGTTQNFDARASTGLSFQNKAYWGSASVAPSTSAAIIACSSAFITTKTKLRVGASCPSTQYPFLCYPSSLGKISKVKILRPKAGTRGDNEWVDFTDLTTVSLAFTNASGNVQTYFVTQFNTLPSGIPTTGYFEIQWT